MRYRRWESETENKGELEKRGAVVGCKMDVAFAQGVARDWVHMWFGRHGMLGSCSTGQRPFAPFSCT